MYINGEVQEWLNWLVSKTSVPATAPRVRIPPSPPLSAIGLIIELNAGGVAVYEPASPLAEPFAWALDEDR